MSENLFLAAPFLLLLAGALGGFALVRRGHGGAAAGLAAAGLAVVLLSSLIDVGPSITDAAISWLLFAGALAAITLGIAIGGGVAFLQRKRKRAAA